MSAREGEVDLYYSKRSWRLGTVVRRSDDPESRGMLVRRVAAFWVDRDSKPPMVRWNGKLDAVEVPWNELERV